MADRRNKLVTEVVIDTGKSEGELKGLGKAADNAAVDVGQLAKELKQSDKPMRDLGDAAQHTGGRVSDAMDNSKDSALGAASAMGEAFGQGGSATDAVGSFGEVVESIAESFGPLGPAVALAGGAIIGAFAGAAAKAAELRDRANEVFDSLVDGAGILDEAFKKQQIQQFIKDNSELVDQVGKLLGAGGLKDLGDAIGGNDAAYHNLNKRVDVTLDNMRHELSGLTSLIQTGSQLTPQQERRYQLLNQQIPVYEELNRKIDDQAGVIQTARGEMQAFNAMTGTATSSMGAYTSSMTANITETQRSIEWQKAQAQKYYDTATAAAVAAQNVKWLNDAQAKRDRRGTAPPGAVAFDEGSGKWLDRSGKPMAAGGPVTAGQAYTVGEYGKETFVPATDGTIVPNGGGLGSSVVIHQTVVTNDPMRLARDTARAMRRAQFRGG